MENYLIDNLDRGILGTLMGNTHTAYTELVKQFSVSPETIRVWVEKMEQAGIITGVCTGVNPKQLGYDVGCSIGIILKNARDYPSALTKLESLNEVAKAYCTTNRYSIFIRVICRSVDVLQYVLINKIQTIDEIQPTETLVVLQNPIMCTIKPWSAFLIPHFSTNGSQRVHNVQYATPSKGGGLW